MKSSTGMVMQLNKNHAYVMTNSGEFLKLKLSKIPPKLGEIYSGEVVKDVPFYKYAITAATLAFLIFFSSTAYAYYTPVASVVVNINPSIKLDVNKWNRIIKSTALNEDGQKVLSELKVRNKSLNDGLDSIVIQAKKDNFINEEYTKNGKTINIDIDSNKEIKDFNISKFEESVKSSNLNLKITTSTNNKTYDKFENSAPQKTKPENHEKGSNLKEKVNNKETESNKNNNKDKVKNDEENMSSNSGIYSKNKDVEKTNKDKKDNDTNQSNGKETTKKNSNHKDN